MSTKTISWLCGSFLAEQYLTVTHVDSSLTIQETSYTPNSIPNFNLECLLTKLKPTAGWRHPKLNSNYVVHNRKSQILLDLKVVLECPLCEAPRSLSVKNSFEKVTIMQTVSKAGWHFRHFFCDWPCVELKCVHWNLTSLTISFLHHYLYIIISQTAHSEMIWNVCLSSPWSWHQ